MSVATQLAEYTGVGGGHVDFPDGVEEDSLATTVEAVEEADENCQRPAESSGPLTAAVFAPPPPEDPPNIVTLEGGEPEGD